MTKQTQSSIPPKEQIEKLIKIYESAQFIKTEKLCRKLLKKYPNTAIIFSILAASLVAQNKLKNALHTYNKIIQFNSKNAEAYYNRAIVYQKLKQYQNAIDSHSKAIKLQAHYPEAFNNRGYAYQHLNELELALKDYTTAVALSPNYAEALFNQGVAFQMLAQYKQAVKSYSSAIDHQPYYSEAFHNRGYAYYQLNELDKALNDYNKAITIKPNYHEAFYNQGIALEDSGKIKDAIKSYKKAIEINEQDLESCWNLSLLLLITGDLKNGWINYECGKYTKNKDRRSVEVPYTTWNGQNLLNKEILITAEQGIGDEIMFCSCLPDIIKQKPKRVIFECDSRITKLINDSFKSIQTVYRKNRTKKEWEEAIGSVDYHLSSGSMPMFFRNSLEQFPKYNSYLKSDKKLTNKWKDRFKQLNNKLNIGISWRGGLNDKNRSIELHQWHQIFQYDANFINLQYGDCQDEINQLKEQYGVEIYHWSDTDPLSNLDNFAAQISALDLVISIDNSTVHFSGALGVDTWVLLPLNANYRWMQELNQSPWYPSMQLFRQTKPNSWCNVFNRLSKTLQSIKQ